MCCCASGIDAIPADQLKTIVANVRNPFAYDLHLRMLPGASRDEDALICLHGMGGDHTLAEVMKSNPAIPYHIVAFNFPDYGRQSASRNLLKSSFGTIEELLPALYAWRTCLDGGADKVHLYGFSAGGGAVVNALAILTGTRYDADLKRIGIGKGQKRRMLESVRNGSVILEAPLKSFDEIADAFGGMDMQMLARKARENGMKPIDNLCRLESLSLDCFVYFTQPDESLGNRDDLEYLRRLRLANRNGRTIAILGKSKGHTDYHSELWEAYQRYLQNANERNDR